MKSLVLALALTLTTSAHAQIVLPELPTILDIAPASRPAGFQITLPDPAGGQLRLGNNVEQVRATIVIAEADKLAVGKTLSWGVWISDDNGVSWKFRAGATWQSYGPEGYFDPIFNRQNPDPMLGIPAADLRRKLVRVEIKLDHGMTAGLKVESQ